MQLFYHPEINSNTKTFFLSKEESNHLVKVLRKNVGDTVYVTNGDGWLFTTEIVDNNPKKCMLQLLKSEKKYERNYYLHLAVAPTKMNDRFEWFLEKATEIGVDEITPILCDHSERKVIKHERLEKVLLSAMKQSLQCKLPKLNSLTPFAEFVSAPHKGQLFIAHCEESYKTPLKRKALADHKITILIGPEGDFSEQEIALAQQKGFLPVTLGNSRLRTETAAIVACHTVALINQ